VWKQCVFHHEPKISALLQGTVLGHVGSHDAVKILTVIRQQLTQLGYTRSRLTGSA
jgi:aspartate carbamoyltransferase regulatory subunit